MSALTTDMLNQTLYEVGKEIKDEVMQHRDAIYQVKAEVEGTKDVVEQQHLRTQEMVKQADERFRQNEDAIKAYRKECFEDIGGLKAAMGWDTIDEHHARYRGWLVLVLPSLQVVHQRSTNQEYGFIKAAYRNGIMLYTIRMDIFLLLTNCVKRIFKKPYFILSLSMFIGYLISFLFRETKIVNKDLGSFIRKYRYRKILEKYF